MLYYNDVFLKNLQLHELKLILSQIISFLDEN